MSNSGPHNAKAASKRASDQIDGSAKKNEAAMRKNSGAQTKNFRPRESQEERLERLEFEAQQVRDRIAFAARKHPLSAHNVKQMQRSGNGETRGAEKEVEEPYLTEDDMPPIQTPNAEEERIGRAEPVVKPKTGNKSRDLLASEDRRQQAEDAGARDAQRELIQQRRDEEPQEPVVPTQEKWCPLFAQEEAKRLADLRQFEFRFTDKVSTLSKVRQTFGWLFVYWLTAITGLGSSLGGSILALIVTVANFCLENCMGADSLVVFLDVTDILVGLASPMFKHLYLLAGLTATWIACVALIARWRTGRWILLKCYYEYKVIALQAPQSGDERADAYSTRDIKHKDPYYADVQYVRANVGLFWMNVDRQVNTVSMELFTQLSVPNILVPGRDPKFVALALQQAAGRIDTVNISRYSVLKERHDGAGLFPWSRKEVSYGEDIFGNTIRMTWAFYLCISERADAQPFRLPP